MAGYNENAEMQPGISSPSGSGLPTGSYGCEVQPMGPLQDMFGSLDVLVGSVHDRTDPQATFSGGLSGAPGVGANGIVNDAGTGIGFGGQAEPPAPAKNVLP